MEGDFQNLTVGTEISKAEVTGVLRNPLPWPADGVPPSASATWGWAAHSQQWRGLTHSQHLHHWAAESPVGLIKPLGHV